MSKRPTKREVEKLVKEYGSPLFVAYGKTLRENIGKYHKLFGGYSGGFSLAYSVKSNPSIALLKIMREAGVMAEVCSLADIYPAELAGFKGKEIIFDGLVKTDEELTLAIKRGFAIVNLESFDEAKRLSELARKLKKKIKVGIRLSFPSSRVGLKSFLGVSYDRFGVSRTGEAERLTELVIQDKNLELIGLHCHTGSNQKRAARYLIAINELVEFMKWLRDKHGLEIKVINLGGGFGVSEITAYKVTDLAIQAGQRLLGQPFRFSQKRINFERVAKKIINHLESKLKANRLKPPQLMFEPGRSLVGNACYLLTKIVNIKRTELANWMIIDAGTNLMPILTIYSEYHEIVVFTKNKRKEKTSIAGPLLYSSDILVSGRELIQGKIGEIMMICDVGAYFDSQANQFLQPRPGVVLQDKGKTRLIKRRERVRDIFSREIF